MAVAGRKPTGLPTRDRNPRAHDWTEIPDVPYSGDVPELPERKDGAKWPTRTLEKWSSWSSMPHCSLWGPAEWDFALDTLEIAAQFHAGDTKLATELRNREKVLGTTGDARRDLRIRYVPVRVEEPAEVTRLDDYRDL